MHCWTLLFDIGIHSLCVVILYTILMCISHFIIIIITFLLMTLLAVYIKFKLGKWVIDKKQNRVIFLFEFKMGYKAA